MFGPSLRAARLAFVCASAPAWALGSDERELLALIWHSAECEVAGCERCFVDKHGQKFDWHHDRDVEAELLAIIERLLGESRQQVDRIKELERRIDQIALIANGRPR